MRPGEAHQHLTGPVASLGGQIVVDRFTLVRRRYWSLRYVDNPLGVPIDVVVNPLWR